MMTIKEVLDHNKKAISENKINEVIFVSTHDFPFGICGLDMPDLKNKVSKDSKKINS